MARMKYQPSSRRKPFNPLQLSTQGITELRRQSDRRIQGMRQNFEAEKEQQRRDREAMKENAALEQDAINRDRRIEVENLKNEELAMSQQESVDRQQAQYDADAGKAILDSLAGLSKTIAVTAAERTAKMKKDQTQAGMTRDISKEYAEAEKAFQSLYLGSSAADVDILENANETNEPFLETLKAIVSQPGLGAIQEKIVANRILARLHGTEISTALQGTDRIYKDAQGNAFSGVEAVNDPGKTAIITDKVRSDLTTRLGLDTAAPGYLDVANEEIQKRSAALIDRAYNGGIAQQKEIAKAKAEDLRSSGKAVDIAKAWELDANVLGKSVAHKNIRTILEDPTSNPSIVSEALAIVDGVDMKVYHKNPEKYSILNADHKRAKQIQPHLATRLKNQRAADKATRDFAKAQLDQFEFENVDTIRQAYTENFEQASRAALERAHKAGVPLTPLMRSIESSVRNKLRDQESVVLQEKIRVGSLSESFVNKLEDPENRKVGIKALENLETQKYGAPLKDVRKGYVGVVKDLLNIDVGANDKSSHRAEMMLSEIIKEHVKIFAQTRDYDATRLQIVGKDGAVQKAKAGDPTSFLTGTPVSGGMTVYRWEKDVKGRSEHLEMLDKIMVKNGSNVAAFAFNIETQAETDATIASTRNPNGTIVYSQGLIHVRDQINKSNPDKEPLELVDLFNEIQKEKTRITGKPHPLIENNLGTQIQSALSPTNLKVQQLSQKNLSHYQAKRVTANATNGMGGINTLSSNTRASMSTGADANEFINMAAASGAKFPELVAAQMILESAGGTILSGTNNFFGQKATENESSTAKQTTEFRDGVERIETANFKNYSSPQESVNDLVSKWYKDYSGYQGVNNANSLEEAAMMLQQQGYATDPKYAQKLIQIANRFR